MKNSISVYAESVEIHGEGDQVNVFLKNIDIEQVIAEFNADAVLESIDFATVLDYINNVRGDE